MFGSFWEFLGDFWEFFGVLRFFGNFWEFLGVLRVLGSFQEFFTLCTRVSLVIYSSLIITQHKTMKMKICYYLIGFLQSPLHLQKSVHFAPLTLQGHTVAFAHFPQVHGVGKSAGSIGPVMIGTSSPSAS